ncbi:MAG: S49 family peptidase, partial [Phycisphaerae bacterium]
MKRVLCSAFVAALVLGTAQPAAMAQFKLSDLTGGGEKKAQPKKIAHVHWQGMLTETPMDVPPLFSNTTPMSLKDLIRRINDARDDDAVVAMILDLDGAGIGLAQIEEVHKAISKFAAVDKEVYINAETMMTASYALASCASHISIVPTGDLWLTGMYGETPYIRGGLDKLGVVPDFEQCGDFKTGAEAITRTEPSKQSKEMTNWLLDSIYDSMINLIAEGRGMDPGLVRKLVDAGPYSAEEAKAAKLVDAVQHKHEFAEDLRDRYGHDVRIIFDYGGENAEDLPQNMFAAWEMFMEMFDPTPKVYTDPSVAIVYVEGMIQTGSAEVSPFGSSSGAYSTTIRKALDAAAEDDSVKAVVMRIDSPGGSALASEIILEASRRVAMKKPLVVSMGNVAGSGGYYVTCASERIFADNHTITSSIGVLAGKLVTTGMWDKLGINWHANKRGAMSGIFSGSHMFSDEERAKMRHYMETVYDVFKGHVVEARGEKLAKPIDELAGGRVFTGAQALELGLVDDEDVVVGQVAHQLIVAVVEALLQCVHPLVDLLQQP